MAWAKLPNKLQKKAEENGRTMDTCVSDEVHFHFFHFHFIFLIKGEGSPSA